jgi:hypothetical protein
MGEKCGGSAESQREVRELQGSPGDCRGEPGILAGESNLSPRERNDRGRLKDSMFEMGAEIRKFRWDEEARWSW